MNENLITDQALANAAAELIKSDKFQEKLQQKLEDTLDSIVSDALRWGDVHNMLKEKINKGLLNDLSNVEMPEMYFFLSKLVQDTATKHYQDVAQVHFVKSITDIMKPAPETMTMQGLLDLLLEKKRESFKECPCDYDEGKEPIIEFEQDDSFSTLTIWMEGKTDKSTYSTRTRDKTPDLTLRFYKNKIMTNPYFHHDSWELRDEITEIFMMFTQGTLITDIDDFNPDYADISVCPYS